MSKHLYFLTIPALRQQDIDLMPNVQSLMKSGSRAMLSHTFPAVTWPAQCNMLTGCTAAEHGVIANGFYWREDAQVEMWTAWNEKIEKPQLWDSIKAKDPNLKTAAWFPMLSKGCGADFVCMPAPIHKPDGSEDLWCYTKPQEFYGELLDELDHFPLKHFWGPLSNIKSSKWIADSAVRAAAKFKPNFFYVYLPHLDYAAQKTGPNSPQAIQAIKDLDQLIGDFAGQIESLHDEPIHWMIASEYVITEVNHVVYPNRILRNAGLLSVKVVDGLEYLDFENSRAWALVDHQFSHVFVKDADQNTIDNVVNAFQGHTGIANVAQLDQRGALNLNHERSGEVVLVSEPNSWQAYYWWHDDKRAPSFARTVDIHQKPGYDPVELHFDMETMSVPLDATLIKGSHGAPAVSESDHGILLSSNSDTIQGESIRDLDVYDLVMNEFAQS